MSPKHHYLISVPSMNNFGYPPPEVAVADLSGYEEEFITAAAAYPIVPISSSPAVVSAADAPISDSSTLERLFNPFLPMG